ncbi:MAG: 1-acyl-sn-glycerol-3-phosphate acyltransferase [Chloroflexota bacterium]|nr:1-acyl-sn-glycerol-3-phosphate acyltransferase [Chloroflexota bacterium]
MKDPTLPYGWRLHPLVRSVALVVQEAMVTPLVALFYRVRVSGQDKLHRVEGPVLFAPNHCLHWDNGIILTALPLSWRWRLAIAAGRETIFANRWRGLLAASLGGAFPVAREGGLRRAIETLRAQLERDFSVLIYPEGKLTVGGPMQPFKAGTGLLAALSGRPVVPMRVKVRQLSLADRIGWPLRGDVEVVFGDPLRFASGSDPRDVTRSIEAAVAAL